jgi:HD-GYP domain-containing protein (c-di-GMP phosphodiesterase class II)
MIQNTSFRQDIVDLNPDLGAMYLALQRQFDRLSALRDIDVAITSGQELKLTLNRILAHVTTQLIVDAATVLLLNRGSRTLEYAAGFGFRTPALQHSRLRVGEGYAGRAAATAEVLHIPDLRRRKTDFLRSPAFQGEGFIVYFAVPLIAKGQVLGVLEIFHRQAFQPDQDWQDFMNMLAGETAIAIDSAQMFQNMQLWNMELTVAFDKAIEGWTHALDLRDKMIEGHTQRVVETTLQLALQMNMPASEMIHIRRGATLHDIGKLAIPDNILLKRGPLDEQEWTIMRRHPLIAVELLSPISHLVPALDIPRSHHEKWDGSGYPFGLAGERIPLAARLFAVVDVYDALTSDRPYRPAWAPEKALDYIQEHSGTHFDPQVVPVFMEMIAQRRQQTS